MALEGTGLSRFLQRQHWSPGGSASSPTPVNGPGKAEEDGLRTRISATPVGDPGSWLDLTRASHGSYLWGTPVEGTALSCSVGLSPFLELCLSNESESLINL